MILYEITKCGVDIVELENELLLKLLILFN